ncbi:RagB/SusD family nutrient uptake outer membrane protein [Puteibacter caeruleilacunae]|nr:RagB/SusD family nutrient uptake outer membrane protein [Puteibacter caeruleilacunae]
MKIKTIIYVALMGVTMAMTTGCNEWLDVLPEDKILKDEFWESKEDVEGMLAAAYNATREGVHAMIVHGEVRGPVLKAVGNDGDARKIDEFDILPSNKWTKWSNYYKAIGYANTVYKMAPTAEANDPIFYEGELKAYQSEALFLRALNYFYLVRTWGDVPLITEPYETDAQEFTMAKSTQEEVLNQIVADLNQAVSTAKLSYDKLEYVKGRATQWSIKALLADVYLWMDNYQKAEEVATDVIKNGPAFLTPPEGWFSIFYPGNSVEGIFELQFSTKYNQKGDLYSWFYQSPLFRVSLMFDTEEEPVYDDLEDARRYGSVYFGEVYKYWGSAPFTLEPVEVFKRSDYERDANWSIYRISDMYLILAEALTEQQKFGEAVDILEELRAARGIESSVSVSMDKVSLEDFILQERTREFVGEGKEWFDLLRIAKRNNYERKDMLMSAVLINASAKDLPVMKSKLTDPNSYYLPIHIDELKNNDKLIQNPYYEDVTKI